MKYKNIIILGLILMTLLNNHYHDEDSNSFDYEIVSNADFFATYSKGKIYIGDMETMLSLENVQDEDIIVIDNRSDLENPSFKILNSAFITDNKTKNEVLEVISEYEELYPSNWNRSVESMRIEWFVHNLSYYFNFKQNKTKDVDLDNKDGKIYENKIIKKILKL